MEDKALFDLDQRGFIPGPGENEEDLLEREARTRQDFEALGEKALPRAHWDWPRLHLQEVYDFVPDSLPAFYSNEGLAPWQGAVSWIEGKRLAAIQLKETFRKGHFLSLYKREEILVHEAVHAARAAFEEDRFEEYFAYATMESKWRRVLGPIVQRPWEVWPFVIACIGGVFFPSCFLLAALWSFLGLIRLIRGHWILKKASIALLKKLGDPRKVRAVLFRLTDREIGALAKGETIGDDSLRWRLIQQKYLREYGKAH